MSKPVDRRTLSLDMQDAFVGEVFTYFTGSTREFALLRTQDDLKEFVFKKIKSGWWTPVQKFIGLNDDKMRVYEYKLIKRRDKDDKWLNTLFLIGYIDKQLSACNVHELYGRN